VARVLVIHRDVAEAAERAARLRAEGFDAEPYLSLGPTGFRGIRADPPDAILIDLMRRPSYGRTMGALLREQKTLRAIPLVFLEGDPGKTAPVRAMLPDAVYAQASKVAAALRRAIRRAPAAPMAPVPKPTPLLSKLGIGEGSRVAVMHRPKGFRLPEGSWRSAQPDDADVVLTFHRSAASLGRELPALSGMMRKGRRLWIVWPKKAGGEAGNLTPLVIREMAQGHGLTDYKVCAVDETWSGMALGVRRATRRAIR
jgi:CheY-like chemotaxis protein